MYIYPSVFRAFGAKWFGDASVRVNSDQACGARLVRALLRKYAPPQVRDWNWPETPAPSPADARRYSDTHSSAALLNDPSQSAVIGKIGYARWPKGPSGRRVASIWNWSFPRRLGAPRRAQRATWLFIMWATCEETRRDVVPVPRSHEARGREPPRALAHADFVEPCRATPQLRRGRARIAEHDTELDWRPRVPQCRRSASACRRDTHGARRERTSKAALDEAQTQVDRIMKG